MEVKARPPVFLTLLQSTLNNEDIERAAKGPREFRHNPSSASFKKPDGTVVGACLRQLYWKATNEAETNQREFTTKLQGGFGNGIHQWLTDQLSKSKEVRTAPESAGRVSISGLNREVSFRLDDLVTYQGELGFLEIKTMQSYAVQRMIKEGGPKDKDILQCLSYFGTNEELRWGALLYVGRDTAYRAEYHLYKDPHTGAMLIEGKVPERKAKPIDLNFEGIVERWKELENYVDNKQLPPRDFKAVLDKEGKVTDMRTKNHVDYKTDYQCKYCSYQDKCWSMSDAKQEALYS